MVKKIILWILLILTCFMIYSFSGANAEKSAGLTQKLTEKVAVVTEDKPGTVAYKNLHKLIRKIGHIVEYAILGIVSFYLALNYQLPLKKSLILSLVFCAFYAGTDEFHQLFVPGRTGRVIDVFIDFCGSAAGIGVFEMIKMLIQKNKTKKA